MSEEENAYFLDFLISFISNFRSLPLDSPHLLLLGTFPNRRYSTTACRGGFVPVAFSSRGYPRQIAKVDSIKVPGFFWCFFFWFCSAVGFFFVLSLSGSHFLLRRARGSTPGTAQSALRCIAGASCTGHGLDHPVIIQRPHHNSNAVEVSGSRHQGSGSATRRE